jgi:hypothetical protein
MQPHAPAVAHAEVGGVRSGKAVKQIIDAAVFLNDHHDVFDMAAKLHAVLVFRPLPNVDGLRNGYVSKQHDASKRERG